MSEALQPEWHKLYCSREDGRWRLVWMMPQVRSANAGTRQPAGEVLSSMSDTTDMFQQTHNLRRGGCKYSMAEHVIQAAQVKHIMATLRARPSRDVRRCMTHMTDMTGMAAPRPAARRQLRLLSANVKCCRACSDRRHNLKPPGAWGRRVRRSRARGNAVTLSRYPMTTANLSSSVRQGINGVTSGQRSVPIRFDSIKLASAADPESRPLVVDTVPGCLTLVSQEIVDPRRVSALLDTLLSTP